MYFGELYVLFRYNVFVWRRFFIIGLFFIFELKRKLLVYKILLKQFLKRNMILFGQWWVFIIVIDICFIWSESMYRIWLYFVFNGLIRDVLMSYFFISNLLVISEQQILCCYEEDSFIMWSLWRCVRKNSLALGYFRVFQKFTAIGVFGIIFSFILFFGYLFL